MSIAFTLTWPLRTLGAMLLQPDKVAHFYWGISIGLVGLWMGWGGMFVVISLAAAKELYDLMHPPHACEWGDFYATVIGGAFAIGVIALHARFP